MRICGRCGAWLEATTIDRTGDPPQFVCPVCGRRETLARYPLWWIAGAAGAGKSALMPHLRRALPEYVVFEGEAIDYWRFADTGGGHAALYDQWLKVAYEILLGGRPVVFVATAYPAQLARCPFMRLLCAALLSRPGLPRRDAARTLAGASRLAQGRHAGVHRPRVRFHARTGAVDGGGAGHGDVARYDGAHARGECQGDRGLGAAQGRGRALKCGQSRPCGRRILRGVPTSGASALSSVSPRSASHARASALTSS
jgi:hypothetical protein